MNNVSLTGRLTRDPELRSTNGGKPVCDMRIAVDNGSYDPTYVDVTTFDGQATACAEHLSKGRQVGVNGRLHYAEWEAEDGSKRSRHSVIGRVEFLGTKRESEPDGTDAAPAEGAETTF